MDISPLCKRAASVPGEPFSNGYSVYGMKININPFFEIGLQLIPDFFS